MIVSPRSYSDPKKIIFWCWLKTWSAFFAAVIKSSFCLWLSTQTWCSVCAAFVLFISSYCNELPSPSKTHCLLKLLTYGRENYTVLDVFYCYASSSEIYHLYLFYRYFLSMLEKKFVNMHSGCRIEDFLSPLA